MIMMMDMLFYLIHQQDGIAGKNNMRDILAV